MRSIFHVFQQFRKGEIQFVANGLAFATVLSLVPFLAVTLAALQYIDAMDIIYPKVEEMILSNFQGPAGSINLQIIKKAVMSIQEGRISVYSSIGLFISSALLLYKIEVGMHRIWNMTNKRPIVMRFFSYSILLVFVPFALAAYVAVTTKKAVLDAVPLTYWHWGGWFVLLFLLYQFVPNIKVRLWTSVVCSAVATAGLFSLVTSFKFLTKHVLSYSRLYGSLAAIPAFLIFVLLFWYIVLIGMAICAGFNSRSSPA